MAEKELKNPDSLTAKEAEKIRQSRLKEKEGSNADEVWNEHMESVGRKPRNKGRVKSMNPGTPDDPQLLGITGAEAETILQENLEQFLPEGEEIPEGDPDAKREALNRLRESGELDAATEALLADPEMMSEREDGESVEVSTQEGEPVPFDELSEELGLDAENVTVTAKVAGEEKEIPLREAIDGYQRREDYSKKTQEVAQRRKQYDEVLQQGQELLTMQAQAMHEAGTLDPERAQALRQRMAQVVQERQALQAERLQNEVLPREAEQLAQKLGIESQEEMEEARKLVAKHATETYGFEPSDLEMVHDHRYVHLAHDAARYRQLMAETADAKEKAQQNRKKGRTLKPGSSGQRKSGGRPSEARKRLKKTGSRRDAEKVLEQMLS